MCVLALRVVAVSALAVAFASWTQAASAEAATQVGAGNLPGCLLGSLTNPRPLMQKFHATMLRVVVGPGNFNGNTGSALPCITAAHAEGYKVMLGVGWASWWPVKTVQSWFSRELTLYGRYLNAIGIGNEEEIVPPAMSPAKYVSMWRAVEPIVKRMTPWAVRVGGEISPWGFKDLSTELRLGLPGIQAVGVHPYTFSFGFSVRQALGLAGRYHLPLWCTEALRDGPDSWPSVSRTVPPSGMKGVAMAAVWDRF